MIRSPCIAAALLLGGPMGLGQSTPSPAERGLVARWQLTKPNIAGRTLKPLTGPLSGTIHAPVKFAGRPPHALILEGNPKARHRITLTEDLPSAGLPTRDITVEAWVRIDRTQRWGAILSAVQDNGSYEKGWVLGTRDRGERFNFGLAGRKPGRITYLIDERPLVPGMWYYVVGTYDGVWQRLYVDGRQAAASKAQSGPIAYPPRGSVTLGAFRDDNELYPLAGQIEQVSVYNRALTAAEIEKRFHARKRLFPDIEAVAEPVVDWPTYLHDDQRTGVTAESLKLPLRLQWVYHARRPPEPAWPPPAKDDLFHKKLNLRPRVIYDRAFHVAAVGERVYFGSSADDKVYCLDARTGREVWAFFTEGPVRLAPTVVSDPGPPPGDAKVVIGSDDGAVYCLRAEDGTLLWKHHLAPRDVRLPGNGRVISLFCVRTGVVVRDGAVRFCAGLFPTQGVYSGTVDLRTGKRTACKQIQNPVQGYLRLRGNRLFAPTGRHPGGAWLGKLARRGKVSAPAARKIQSAWPYAMIAAGLRRGGAGLRPGEAGPLHFGGGEGQVAALRPGETKPVWSAKVDGKAYSLAVARGRLFVSTDRGVIYCFASSPAMVRHIRPPAPTPFPQDGARKQYAEAAEKIVALAGIRKGYCLVLGAGRGRLAAELAGRTDLKIVCREPDAAAAKAARRALDATGLYGRVVVHHGPLTKLPYTDYLFNLIVHEGLATGMPFSGSRAEVLRVLRPCGGAAVLGLSQGQVVRRGPLAGEGEWTHQYADPGNSACSSDTRVKGTMAFQWFGRPGPRQMVDRHNRAVAPLYKNGRVFLSARDHVVAMDAYNGTILWRRDLADSVRPAVLKNCGNMAAADDRLFVAAGRRCLAFDAQTGRQEAAFSVPGPGGDWGYVAASGGVLFGSQTRRGASRWKFHPTSWVIAYRPEQPVICSDLVFAHDVASRKRLWVHKPESGVVINPTLAVAEGRIYFVESANPQTRKAPDGRVKLSDLLAPGAALVALDIRTGKPAWRRPVELAMRHVLYLSCAKGVVLITGSKTISLGKNKRVRYDLHAFSAETGRPLWNLTHTPAPDHVLDGGHGELTQNPAIVGETVYLYQSAYHLRTGKPVAGWRWRRGGHGCGAISTSAHGLFNRGQNPRMTELKTGRQSVLTRVSRPGCWINIVPAGGLVLIPEASSGCTCPYAIQTSLALRPTKPESGPAKAPPPPTSKEPSK